MTKLQSPSPLVPYAPFLSVILCSPRAESLHPPHHPPSQLCSNWPYDGFRRVLLLPSQKDSNLNLTLFMVKWRRDSTRTVTYGLWLQHRRGSFVNIGPINVFIFIWTQCCTSKKFVLSLYVSSPVQCCRHAAVQFRVLRWNMFARLLLSFFCFLQKGWD